MVLSTTAFASPLPLSKSCAGASASTAASIENRVLRTPARRAARMTLDAESTTSMTKSTIAERKAALLEAVKDIDFGRAVLDDKEKQEELDKLIAALEEVNPTKDPADHPLRRAKWLLVYTNSPIVLGRNRPGFARAKRSWQILDMTDGEDEGTMKNEEEGAFNLLGREVTYRNQIVGVCRALKGERIRLRFEKFTLGNWLSVPFPGPVVGWQDQTFLDDELRVARTHYGNVFVLKRDDWDA